MLVAIVSQRFRCRGTWVWFPTRSPGNFHGGCSNLRSNGGFRLHRRSSASPLCPTVQWGVLRCERSRLHDLRGVSSACTPDFVANSHAPVPTMSATDGPATGTTAPVDVDNPETDLPAAEGPVAAGAADGTHTTAVPAVVAAHPPRGPASDPYAPDGPAPPTLPQAASVEAPSTPLVADAGADDGRVPRDVDAVKLFVGQVRHAPSLVRAARVWVLRPRMSGHRTASIAAIACGALAVAVRFHVWHVFRATCSRVARCELWQIPRSLDEEQLRELFGSIGPIHELAIIRNRTTGAHRGTAPERRAAAMCNCRASSLTCGGRLQAVPF